MDDMIVDSPEVRDFSLLVDLSVSMSSSEIGNDQNRAQYARGLVVGIVTTLMALGYQFPDAIAVLQGILPSTFPLGIIPAHWTEDVLDMIKH